jgi:uncharacterized protein (DUF4415 family)
MKLATTAKLPKKTSAKVNDPDNPAWTEDMLGAPVLKRGRGPQAAPTKVLTSVRLDADILEFFKAKGAGYQSRINAALRTEVERNLTARSSPATRKRVTGLDSNVRQDKVRPERVGNRDRSNRYAYDK